VKFEQVELSLKQIAVFLGEYFENNLASIDANNIDCLTTTIWDGHRFSYEIKF